MNDPDIFMGNPRGRSVSPWQLLRLAPSLSVKIR